MLETATSRNLYTEEVGLGHSPFKDVDDWRITWANVNGIIQGTGLNKFSPTSTITREQAATLMLNVYEQAQRILGVGGDDAAQEPVAAAAFADDSAIAKWAKDNVYRATELTIMKGTGSNMFTPKGKLTYEQTFVLLQNVFELIEKQKRI
jgi:hypothetical protein